MSIIYRTRQTNENHNQPDVGAPSTNAAGSGSGIKTTLLYLLLALASGAGLYYVRGESLTFEHQANSCLYGIQFRDFVRVLLEPWMDFADSTLHGVVSNTPAVFTADIEKRDAIKKAFTVCPLNMFIWIEELTLP